MDPFKIALIAIGLGADALSVCMGIGVKWHGPRQKFRLAWHMGLFQFIMPIIGWSGGRELAQLLSGVGGYIAAALVFAVGAKMMFEALKHHPLLQVQVGTSAKDTPAARHKDPTRGWSLFALSIATSIDALVVGFSMGLRDYNIWASSLVIGVVAGGMALAGVIIGKRMGKAFGTWAEMAGAVVLMAIGVAFIWL